MEFCRTLASCHPLDVASLFFHLYSQQCDVCAWGLHPRQRTAPAVVLEGDDNIFAKVRMKK